MALFVHAAHMAFFTLLLPFLDHRRALFANATLVVLFSTMAAGEVSIDDAIFLLRQLRIFSTALCVSILTGLIGFLIGYLAAALLYISTQYLSLSWRVYLV